MVILQEPFVVPTQFIWFLFFFLMGAFVFFAQVSSARRLAFIFFLITKYRPLLRWGFSEKQRAEGRWRCIPR